LLSRQFIRAVDNETIVFFAAITFDDIHPAGFEHAPGGPSYSDRFDIVAVGFVFLLLPLGVVLPIIGIIHLKAKSGFLFTLKLEWKMPKG
jgi:hypothetical protein